VFSNQGIYETTPEELVFEKQLTTYWTNFGNSGTPNALISSDVTFTL
jgi:hypothetical protein